MPQDAVIKQTRTPSSLTFEVSSGLKRVLGRELITDDQVAIFELVKNSFDAGAKHVNLYFSDDSIWVVDDGCGMSYEDLKSKWLFVAYSAKRDVDDFREQVADRRHYAGSKGIGRFSSDRLGEGIYLQTRPKADPHGSVHCIRVDWSTFEANDKQRFETIPVTYSKMGKFELPEGIEEISHGTAIEILKARTHWNRATILKLKASLAKLINPFGADVDGFRITVTAPREREIDEKAWRDAEAKRVSPRDIVNGDVGNFIFSDLRSKTTFLEVRFDGNLNFIESKLVDRGEQVYRISEANKYPLLRYSGFRCELYYLNRSAKQTFAARVGLPSVQFGSVFLFRNDFRVYPIGEEGTDWFGIDRRKQQGYARFLGTRDVIGRIDVSGNDADFQEASSRNQGLIDTLAVGEMRKCFREICLKRLERYVVPVSWADKGEADASDLSRLMTDTGRARVSAAVASLVDNEDIQLLEYSHNLIGLLNERSAQFEQSLVSLRRIAEKVEDRALLSSIEEAERRFDELKKSEADARRVADLEREAKEIAQQRAVAAEMTAARTEAKLQQEKQLNLFLRSISSLDTDTILNMHHQITIYSVDMELQLENFIAGMDGRDLIPSSQVLSAMEQISFLNKKIKAISKFATKANFRLESEAIQTDLAQFVVDYIERVACEFSPPGLGIEVTNEHPGFYRSFKPIDISVVIDNFISNARKARASAIRFTLTQPKGQRGTLRMDVRDDGRGISPEVDVERLFEKGFTTTDGSGLGLYHVRHVLGEMGGSVRIDNSAGKGAAFIVEVAKR